MLTIAWNWMSLGKRYPASACLYLAAGLALSSLLPGTTSAVASCGYETPCLSGEICCGGQCVPEDYICCADGSAGPAENCYCCSGCEDSTCTDPPTLHCVEEEE